MEVTLSSKNQIVVPQAGRKALGLKAGDKLLVVARGENLILLKKPEDFHKAISGLGRGLYSESYLQQERDSWDHSQDAARDTSQNENSSRLAASVGASDFRG